jgi:glycine/D-amino acid oxidase-like deaminating enzyme
MAGFFIFCRFSLRPSMMSDTDNNDVESSASSGRLDYIILGQGICGTFLSYYLLKAGKKVLVIDESKPFTASKAASGVINPVTGRRIVRTWRIEELLPFALEAYEDLGREINMYLIKSISILDFHASTQMKEAFVKRMLEGEDYLQIPPDAGEWTNYFNFYFGVGAVSPSLLIDLNTMLSTWRQKLKEKDLLLEEVFDWNECSNETNHIAYKNIKADKVICCDGVAGFDNPYFNKLPYAKIKGEAIIARIPTLPATYIYKQGLSIVPWKQDLFWIGSSYEWNYDDVLPTTSFLRKVETHLQQWLKMPYTIVDHFASERPATIERRPFVGVHPHHPSVAIFNGMGTKGCSLAPFFAYQLTKHLLEQQPLYAEVDVQRFKRILMPI